MSVKVCHQYEARWEDLLYRGRVQVAPGSELAGHLAQCASCREAFRAAAEAGELLRALEPAVSPQPYFATRVMAAIRAEEARRETASLFWRPLEALARRLAWAAAILLLVLSAYQFGFNSGQQAPQMVASDVREVFQDPAVRLADKDEVLERLAENGNGR